MWLKTPYILVHDVQQTRRAEGRRHRILKKREVKPYFWTPTDRRDRTRSRTAARRIAAQTEGEDAQRLATFRDECGNLRPILSMTVEEDHDLVHNWLMKTVEEVLLATENALVDAIDSSLV
ncbi:hypothetical protein NDU88_011180 [Pleurodeles waltl]|uniref:Uncharacterized protein n=1 Tax=Pleurodeles waltl TaxID=8319 RepID=A0AAV7QWT6_PLEWA|nr:hypothetical protein NDU88_011180 [Pleurodeles waltl]